MLQVVPKPAVRYAVIFLAIVVMSFELWKLKSFLLGKESTHQVYLDVDKRYSVLIRTHRELSIVSDRSTVMWNLQLKVPNADSAPHLPEDKLGRDSSTARPLHVHESMNSITDSLLFGHGDAVQPFQNIMEAPWVSKLQVLLTKTDKVNMSTADTNLNTQQQLPPRRQITVVVSNSNYTLSLLNWLVAALVRTSPPLKNVIVISFDETLQALLDKKEIVSVYVNPETIIRGRMHTRSSHIWIARCTVYRLLNHWGYDVVAYDTDAIVLKNLQDILDTHAESDVVASAGIYPFKLGAKWGMTLCMGVILIRSTRSTGESRSCRQWEEHTQHILLHYWSSCD